MNEEDQIKCAICGAQPVVTLFKPMCRSCRQFQIASTQQNPTLEGWRVKYVHKINPEDNDFYGNDCCGCLSADQIDEIVAAAERKAYERVIDSLPDGYLRIEDKFTEMKFIKAQLRAKFLNQGEET